VEPEQAVKCPNPWKWWYINWWDCEASVEI